MSEPDPMFQKKIISHKEVRDSITTTHKVKPTTLRPSKPVPTRPTTSKPTTSKTKKTSSPVPAKKD